MDSFQRIHPSSPIFQNTDTNGDELSLRSHISKHFFGSDTEQPSHQKPKKPQALEKQKPTFTRPANTVPTSPAGHQLYGLDTELQSGIEHLLPTPSFRYRIMKERIRRERDALEAQLKEYQALSNPSDALRDKIQTLRKKLLVLQRHENHVNYKINQLYGNHNWVFHAVNLWQKFKHQWQQGSKQFENSLNIQKALHQLDPKRAHLNNLNQRMAYLTNVLDSQLSQNTLHADELADVMNQYDRTCKQAAQLQAQLPKDGSFWNQLRYLLK